MALRLFIYARVSKDDFKGLSRHEADARRKHSINTQLAGGRRYCAMLGHEVVGEVIDNGVSGERSLIKRPDGGPMVRAILDGAAEGFVVNFIDRAFRSTLDGLLTEERFKRRGLTIHSASELVDTSTAIGRFTFRQLLSNAEYERDRISERCTDVANALMTDRKPWGPVPFGCVEHDGLVWRDPATWPLRVWIVEQRQGATPTPYSRIAEQLKAQGVLPPGGGRRWHASTLRRVVNSHHVVDDYPMLPTSHETGDSTSEEVCDA